MHEVDVVDMTWVDVAPSRLAAALASPANWAAWWPRLQLTVQELRGPKGVRWLVASGHGATVRGSMEVWLRPVDDGTVVYYFLRLDGTARPLRARERRRFEHGYRTRAKQVFWALGDEVDPGRLRRVGAPPTATGPIP